MRDYRGQNRRLFALQSKVNRESHSAIQGTFMYLFEQFSPGKSYFMYGMSKLYSPSCVFIAHKVPNMCQDISIVRGFMSDLKLTMF